MKLSRLFGIQHGDTNSHPCMYLFSEGDVFFDKEAPTFALIQGDGRLKLKQRSLAELAGIQSGFQGLHETGTVIYGVPPADLLKKVTRVSLPGNKMDDYNYTDERYLRLRPLRVHVELSP